MLAGIEAQYLIQKQKKNRKSFSSLTNFKDGEFFNLASMYSRKKKKNKPIRTNPLILTKLGHFFYIGYLDLLHKKKKGLLRP